MCYFDLICNDYYLRKSESGEQLGQIKFSWQHTTSHALSILKKIQVEEKKKKV